jgi:hypothetical protein
MKPYIAGPMTGLPEYNYPAFMAAEEQLVAAGYEVENPAQGLVDGWEWQNYMRRGITQLMRCDGIALLPNWHKSKGAQIEYEIARSLEWPRYPARTWLLDAQYQADMRAAGSA